MTKQKKVTTQTVFCSACGQPKPENNEFASEFESKLMFHGFTRYQAQIAQCLVNDLRVVDIAAKFFVGEAAIKYHIAKLYKAFGVKGVNGNMSGRRQLREKLGHL